MLPNRFSKLRFNLKSVLVLMLGIAIGYSLNVETLKLLTGVMPYSSTPPPYVIEPPDRLKVVVSGKNFNAPQFGLSHRIVGPDGRFHLDVFDSVYVAGMTIEEARNAIEQAVGRLIESPQVSVDVVAYNSKNYYIIQQRSGGDTVLTVPITGNETVLDAIARIGGVKSPDSTHLCIVRSPRKGVGSATILPIEWTKVAHEASMSTNHPLLPGDRVIISQAPAATTMPTSTAANY